LVSYEKAVYIDSKLNSCLKITGIINSAFRLQNTLKKTRTTLNNTLALPALLYGSGNWTVTVRDTRRITAADMKCVRTTAEYTWTDFITNREIAKELNITSVLDKIQAHRRNWLQHVNRMPCNILVRIRKNYRPKG
jgi:hypothetical protein